MIKTFNNKTPSIASSAYVDETALVLGDVVLGEDVSIWPMTVIRGDIHQITIASRTNIQDGTIIHVTHAGDFNEKGFATHLGSNVIVGHRVVLHGCTIHDYCLIGMGAIIMDGAIIHSNVIVGAGSLVPPNKILTGGFLWMGSPVRKIRAIYQKEFEFIRYSANYYIDLKNKYIHSDSLSSTLNKKSEEI